MFDYFGLESWGDFIFEGFGVHEGQCVVVVHYEDGVAGSP